MVLPDVSVFELFVRYLVAIIATIVAGLVWRGLDLHFLKPRPLFVYLGAVVSIQAVWRWFIVTLAYADDSFYPAGLLTYVQPINAALLALLLISIGLLALWRVREGNSHDE